MLEIRITIDAPELANTPVQKSTAPQYTREKIMQAGAALMEAGKISELTKFCHRRVLTGG